MLNISNFNKLIDKYEVIVAYCKDNKLTKESFYEEIYGKTEFGHLVVNFVRELKAEEESTDELIKEIADTIFE